MSNNGEDSNTNDIVADMPSVESSESEKSDIVCNVSTANRFVGGWGNESSQVAQGRKKRKKVSSKSRIDTQRFDELPESAKLSCLFYTITEIKKEQSRFHKVTKGMHEAMANLNKRTVAVERRVDQQSKFMKTLAYKSVDSEARSRRNNIIIWGVTEKVKTNIENLVLGFLEDELDIDTSYVVIDRAHRMGSEYNRTKPDPKRPIIIRFRDYGDVETVMRRAYLLKGTPFGLDRDYPMEIANARKELYKSQEAQKARNDRKKVQIKYPAKLFIEGKLIHDKFPEWQQLLKGDRIAFLDDNVQGAEDDNNKGTRRNGDEYNTVMEVDSSSSEFFENENVFKVVNTKKRASIKVDESSIQNNADSMSLSTTSREQNGARPKNNSKSSNLPAGETSRQHVSMSKAQIKSSSNNAQNAKNTNPKIPEKSKGDNAQLSTTRFKVNDQAKNRLGGNPTIESSAAQGQPGDNAQL